MDAIIMMIRNSISCVKAMNFFPDSFLYDKTQTPFHKGLPTPFSDTTPIEALLSFCQVYGLIFTTLGGIRMITTSGMYKLLRINKLLLAQQSSPSTGDLANKIVDSSLKKEASEARRSIFMGVNVLIFGLSFIWMIASSWHFLHWVGGFDVMMYVFTLFEAAYIPFLYYMVKDGNYSLAKADRMKDFSAVLNKSDGALGAVGGEKLVNAETYSWLVNGWTPFWSSGSSFVAKPPSQEEDNKNLTEEISKVQENIHHLLYINEQDSDEKEAKAIKQSLLNTADRLQKESHVVKINGRFEFVYLILNFFAFYGFFVGCVIFFFNEEESQPTLVRNIKLGWDNQNAEWYGYFIGGLMWVIDPALRLANPAIVGYLTKPKPSAKVKTD